MSRKRTPAPWHIEPLQEDGGKSIAVCEAAKGIVAVLEAPASGEATDFTREEDEADARRIVAAVNACEGIPTEALEQGVVRRLLEALQGCLFALNENCDGSGPTKKTAIEEANAVIGSTKINRHRMLAARRQIDLGWSVEDVQAVRPELSDEQAWEVLQEVERRHDATLGITWDTLEWAAETLFGPSPD